MAANELVVRHVIVEGLDHPVAIAPGVVSNPVALESHTFAEADHVQPVASPALAVRNGFHPQVGSRDAAGHRAQGILVSAMKYGAHEALLKGGWVEEKRINRKWHGHIRLNPSPQPVGRPLQRGPLGDEVPDQDQLISHRGGFRETDQWLDEPSRGKPMSRIETHRQGYRKSEGGGAVFSNSVGMGDRC